MIERSTDRGKDAELIAEIERNCFSTPWTAEQVKNSNDSTVFFLARVEEKVVGYGGMYTVLDEGYVTNIGVLPEFRRRGIGAKIVNELINFSTENSLSFLSLEVRVSN
ncbi:MAG: GNAT family N-acetyltransferase, partial [Clostridia bacterium]|nr:GNAT family N-acetyltransferase [Clostridia bacterium]